MTERVTHTVKNNNINEVIVPNIRSTHEFQSKFCSR